ncbi:MAG: hypothetical protein JNK15_03025 [Planctomycetes bacterium]|nr:hypothetical protein [Planctomycetota bacterium]
MNCHAPIDDDGPAFDNGCQDLDCAGTGWQIMPNGRVVRCWLCAQANRPADPAFRPDDPFLPVRIPPERLREFVLPPTKHESEQHAERRRGGPGTVVGVLLVILALVGPPIIWIVWQLARRAP